MRENLLAIDELRDEQDQIYQELHDCFGLERCRKQENFIDGPPSHGENIQAGALLTTLREARLGLEGQQSVLEQSIRQQQRLYENRFGSRSGSGSGSSFRGSRTGGSSSSSSSSRTTSYSSSSYSNSYRSSNSVNSNRGGYSNGYPATQVSSEFFSSKSIQFDDFFLQDYDDYYDEGPAPNRG